ncbi:hypothetical protein ACIQU5_20320 [Streptomyces sp. NPDC090306]|uniref:hypothetical protein n=1 Tax=Streptomyces sp. NPDC090306 TaxID=3365961 RepID=UPI00380F8ACD
MPEHYPAMRVCRDCDGHASAMVTTGDRDRDGSRTVLPVVCPACKGTGTARPTVRLSAVRWTR